MIFPVRSSVNGGSVSFKNAWAAWKIDQDRGGPVRFPPRVTMEIKAFGLRATGLSQAPVLSPEPCRDRPRGGQPRHRSLHNTTSTVSSSCAAVFFSERLAHSRTEQVAELADVQMPVNRAPTAHLEMIHAQLVLRLPEAMLDREPRERHVQQPLELLDVRAGRDRSNRRTPPGNPSTPIPIQQSLSHPCRKSSKHKHLEDFSGSSHSLS